MEIKVKETKLKVEGEKFEIFTKGKVWKSDSSFEASILLQNDRHVLFQKARKIKSELYKSGCGEGILTHYHDLKGVNFAFDTLIWIEEINEEIHFEWIPVNDQGFEIKEVIWPSPFVCVEPKGYTLIPYMQGVLLMNDDKNRWEPVPFNGQLCSAAAYMPWLSQFDENKNGYIMINETPWDARYVIEHEENQIGSKASMRWLPSLGKMSYARLLKYVFRSNSDYNDMCKIYRNYVKGKGQLKTLTQKCIDNPTIDQLIGSAFVHKGIKMHINKGSRFYETLQNRSESLTTFEERIKDIQLYREAGIKKLYLHLDGWGYYGYDNNHPDILPPCPQAGGYEGMKKLADYLQEANYLFGIHDQYRDYYHRSCTYDIKSALQNADGSYIEHANWAGGKQNYLCAKLAIHYVRRNYETLFKNGIHPQCAYLDVFTCNELDECNNPMHKMSRKDCVDARRNCFDYLLSNHILSSSEECVDWAIPSLVFSHYGPYEFMMNKEGVHRGMGVPLFNLVYHDCVILPWPMEKRKEDYMLYALLNGGAAYLQRDAAYPNTDATFNDDELSFEEKKKRYEEVAKFHERVAKLEMVSHQFIEKETIQKTTFSNGSEVIINLEKGIYQIKRV